MMLFEGNASVAGGEGEERGTERDALVVVGDVAGECGETDVGREREHGAVRREALGPLIPCVSANVSLSDPHRCGVRAEDTHKPCIESSRSGTVRGGT